MTSIFEKFWKPAPPKPASPEGSNTPTEAVRTKPEPTHEEVLAAEERRKVMRAMGRIGGKKSAEKRRANKPKAPAQALQPGQAPAPAQAL
jgi:hypothetical protein